MYLIADRTQLSRPVPDFTTNNITCNVGGNIAAKGTIPVVPGDKVLVLPYCLQLRDDVSA